jgi:hypothetical protein
MRSVLPLLIFLAACTTRPSSGPDSTARGQGFEDGRDAQYGALSVQPALPSTGVSYTTIAEILKHPSLFEGQTVRLTGKVGTLQGPGPGPRRTASVFELVDSTKNTVEVTLEGPQQMREGQDLTVEGRLTLSPLTSSSPPRARLVAARIVASTAAATDAPSASKGPKKATRRASPPASRQPRPPKTEDAGKIF